MKNNQIYSMTRLENSQVVKNADLFLFAYDGENRACHSLNYLIKNKSKYKNIFILTYNTINLQENINSMKSILKTNYEQYEAKDDQKSFVECIKNIDFKNMKSIIIDISCMRTIHLFLLMGYLNALKCSNIIIINTIPYDYIFTSEPFLSYHSYIGDLNFTEIPGYSGMGDMSQNNDLFIFIGFEGSLSSKVIEGTSFKTLYLINTIPSYYQKYKDISMVNNYNVITTNKNIILHTPADNPFEVYNLLDSKIDNNIIACVAPLSTKPISLGICLYALEHKNVRVVYPDSDKYNDIKSHDAYISYVYEIFI